jgi:mRNA-degrading endonuclease toxin of MazEF toxin-antitoxin module
VLTLIERRAGRIKRLDEAAAAADRLRQNAVRANERNGLNSLSRLMVDKITTVPKNKLGHRIGHLDVKDIERVDQAIFIFLGLGG